jgi:putative DNA primase/helicase
LGRENVSGETLSRLLEYERFSVASLYGKMANVDADVSADVIFNNTGIIKKLTGNDLNPGEFKFKNPFAFKNYAKLFFSCNKIPDTEDLTDAFFRRILIINFVQQFFAEKEDVHLIDKLSTDDELSGLLYELLSRLPRILSDGLKKTTSESIAQTYDKFTRGSNPVKYFVEKTLLYPAAGSKIPKLDLYQKFEEFCRDFGLAPESQQSFSRKLSEEHHLEVKRGRIKGELVYCWMDVQIRDWKKEEQENNKLENLEDFSEQTKEDLK